MSARNLQTQDIRVFSIILSLNSMNKMQGTRINKLKLWHDINKWQTILNNTTKMKNIERKQ